MSTYDKMRNDALTAARLNLTSTLAQLGKTRAELAADLGIEPNAFYSRFRQGKPNVLRSYEELAQKQPVFGGIVAQLFRDLAMIYEQMNRGEILSDAKYLVSGAPREGEMPDLDYIWAAARNLTMLAKSLESASKEPKKNCYRRPSVDQGSLAADRDVDQKS